MHEYANYRSMTGDFAAASTLNALSFQYSKENDLPNQQECVEQRWAISKALAMEKEKETSKYLIANFQTCEITLTRFWILGYLRLFIFSIPFSFL